MGPRQNRVFTLLTTDIPLGRFVILQVPFTLRACNSSSIASFQRESIIAPLYVLGIFTLSIFATKDFRLEEILEYETYLLIGC